MEDTNTTRPMADLFGNFTFAPTAPKRTSERSELVRYFYENAKAEWSGKTLSCAYVGMRLSHLTLHDLYAFKSMCEDRRRSGYPWAKYFWGSLKAHTWDSGLVGARLQNDPMGACRA